MLKISIIIPTFNEEGYIGRLLDSIARQTVAPFEVIVVDNHSTDKTCQEITARSSKLPLRGIGLPQGLGGIGLSRNVGAEQATGDVLLFLDADVELRPSFLKNASLEFLRRQLDFAGAHFYVDPDCPKVDQIGAKAFSLYHASFQFSKNPMGSGFCIMAKKSWHDRIHGFNNHFRHSEDHDYVKRAVDAGAKFRLLKSVQFKLSNRRYVHDGRFTVLSLYTKAEVNRLFFNYKFAPREEALYGFGAFTKAKKRPEVE